MEKKNKKFAKYNGKMVEVEDCTPTWESVLPVLIETIDCKSSKQELLRMAQFADKYKELLEQLKEIEESAVSAIETLLKLIENPVIAFVPQNKRIIESIKDEITKYRNERLAEG